MDRSHEPSPDPKGVKQNPGNGRKAVRGAGSVRYDVMIGVVILVLIDPITIVMSFSRRSADNHLLGTAGQVCRSLVLRAEYS